MLEWRPRGVPGRFHRAAPVIHSISSRPRYHLQDMIQAFLENACLPTSTLLYKPSGCNKSC